MPDDHQPLASLAEVARRCREETERFFRRLAHDTQYCYELFRRALAQRNGEAFALLIQNYQGLVNNWVRRHPQFPQTGEEPDLFTTGAFERLWIAIPPARFARFPDLRSLLRYLQMCAHCSVADYIRSSDPVVSLDQEDHEGTKREPAAPEPVLTDAERSEIWQAVLAELRTEKERIILHACFAMDMKPREICEEFAELFESVQDVYRTKQNVLERLRRNEALCRLLASYA